MNTYTKDNTLVNGPSPVKVVTSNSVAYNEEKEPSFLALVGGLAEKTGMHGLPNVQRSNSLFRKIFWLLITIAGLSFLVWQIVIAVEQYYSYPTTTTEISQNTPSLQFPAVTICNLNPMRINAMDEAGPNIKALFEGRTSNADGQVKKKPNKYFDWDSEEPDKEDEDFKRSNQFIQYYAALPKNSREKLGYNISTFLLSCSYNGRTCGPKNFTQFTNYLYGNCFTFNAFLDSNESRRSYSNKPGPLYGLSLLVYINQAEYIKDVAETAGVRVTIHDQTEMPFPEDRGISTSPGTLSSIGMRLTKHFREDPPHGACKNFSNSETIVTNAFLNELKNISYTEAACKKTCYQQNVMSKCGCADPIYNFKGDAFVNEKKQFGNKEFAPCRYDNKTETNCKNAVQEKFSQGKLNCKSKCPPACVQNEYQLSASYSAFPSNVKIGDTIDTLLNRNEHLYEKLEKSPVQARKEYVLDNVLKINVYFSTLSYIQITTEASYGISNLLSDLGGQVGLWLGFSVITLFEFIELAFDVGFLCCFKMKPKPPTQVNP